MPFVCVPGRLKCKGDRVEDLAARYGSGLYPVLRGPCSCDCGKDPQDPLAQCSRSCASRTLVVQTPQGPMAISGPELV